MCERTVTIIRSWPILRAYRSLLTGRNDISTDVSEKILAPSPSFGEDVMKVNPSVYFKCGSLKKKTQRFKSSKEKIQFCCIGMHRNEFYNRIVALWNRIKSSHEVPRDPHPMYGWALNIQHSFKSAGEKKLLWGLADNLVALYPFEVQKSGIRETF